MDVPSLSNTVEIEINLHKYENIFGHLYFNSKNIYYPSQLIVGDMQNTGYPGILSILYTNGIDSLSRAF